MDGLRCCADVRQNDVGSRGGDKVRFAIAAAALLAASSAVAATATSTAAPRLRPRVGCARALWPAKTVALSASVVRPTCRGAALMAADIHANASSRFPRNLPATWTVFAQGAKRSDARARYQCRVSNKSVPTGNGRLRRTTALCVNVGGDNFVYAFDMA